MIDVEDGERDMVDCGPGRGPVAADRRDRFVRCERVNGRCTRGSW